MFSTPISPSRLTLAFQRYTARGAAKRRYSDEPGTTATLSYRSEAFSRVKQKNRERLEQAEAAGKVKVLLSSNVEQIDVDAAVLDQAGKKIKVKNDAVIVCAGGILPTPFLKELGVQVDTKFGTA